MLTFQEYATARQINKKLIDQYGKYKIYSVNGEAVRNRDPAAEEFGGSGTHAFYPKVIPEDEIWIEDDIKPKEQEILITSALYQLKQIKNGISPKIAYDAAMAKEKDYRDSVHLSKQNPSKTNQRAPKGIYLSKYGRIKDEDVEVWLVDGEKVRNKFKTDFIEGAHGFCYGWTPNDEIWIEKGPHTNKEAPLILLHEYVERTLMKYKKMPYEKAHKIAAKVEFSKRPNFSKKDALALTKAKALEYVGEINNDVS